MNWAHVHQSLLGVTLQQINPILISTIEVLFGKFEISELHSNLFKAYYLSKTNQFTIVQIQLAQSLLNNFKSQNPPNALYDILESIVTLTKQQLLKDNDAIQLQTHVYDQLLRNGVNTKRSKSSTPRQKIKIDYSYLKLTNHKRQKTAFNDLTSSVQIQDANSKVDNYKLNKSTDTTQIPLRQMPKSKLHNYYVKIILHDVDHK